MQGTNSRPHIVPMNAICFTVYDPCVHGHSCQNGATCDRLKTGYKCWCTDEFTGYRCESKHTRARIRRLQACTLSRQHRSYAFPNLICDDVWKRELIQTAVQSNRHDFLEQITVGIIVYYFHGLHTTRLSLVLYLFYFVALPAHHPSLITYATVWCCFSSSQAESQC